MSENESRNTGGRIFGLITGLVALATAAISAGLIHSSNTAEQAPAPVSTSSTPTSAQTSAPTSAPSLPAVSPAVVTSSQGSTDWVSEVDGFCLQVQEILNQHRATLANQSVWARYALFGAATKDVDEGIRSVRAGADSSRLQQMTHYWDAASDYLIQAQSLAQSGDLAGANADLVAYADPNAHGNQIADDLDLSSCADLQLPG